MSTPLQQALALLPPEATRRSVVRAEPDPTGALILCLEGPLARRWLRHEDRRLVPIEPATDARLPLAAALSGPEDEARAEVLAYRPGRRLVLRHRSHDRGHVEKGYRPKRWRAAVSRHRDVLASLADPAVDFVIPRLVDVLASHASLGLEHLEGEPIGLTASDADRFFAVGAALRSLQDADLRGPQETFGPLDELRVVDEWADRCRRLTGWEPEGWSRTRSAVSEAAPALPAPQFASAHRDLHDGQLLTTSAGVALLDFDLLCRADSCLDPANLLAHLTLRVLQGRAGASEEGVLACGSALIEGLDRNRERGFWERLRFYETTSFLRLAFVYSLRPCWPRLPATLAEYGRRCLAEISK